MIVTRLIRRFRGFARFALFRGGSPERFITLASKQGISVRNAHHTGGEILATPTRKATA